MFRKCHWILFTSNLQAAILLLQRELTESLAVDFKHCHARPSVGPLGASRFFSWSHTV